MNVSSVARNDKCIHFRHWRRLASTARAFASLRTRSLDISTNLLKDRYLRQSESISKKSFISGICRHFRGFVGKHLELNSFAMISLFFFLFFVSGICARIGDQSVEEMSSPCLRPQRQRRVFSPQSFRAEEEADPPQDGVDSQQPDSVPDGAGCQKPGSETMTVRELCSLPPSRGTGNDDIYRYYFNPVVNQCLPFSYTGKGGNSNRFVSIKNCYEICHPSEASVKKPRVLSAIRAYLIPSRKGDECPKPPTTPAPREVVVRHIAHPLDPSKTLTIVQNAKYIERPKEFRFDDPKDTEKTRRLIQYERQ